MTRGRGRCVGLLTVHGVSRTNFVRHLLRPSLDPLEPASLTDRSIGLRRVCRATQGAWGVSGIFRGFQRPVPAGVIVRQGSLTVHGVFRKFRAGPLRRPSLGSVEARGRADAIRQAPRRDQIGPELHQPHAGVMPGAVDGCLVVPAVRQNEERADVADQRCDAVRKHVRGERRIVDVALAFHTSHRVVEALPLLPSHRALVEGG